jgi:hypothetical protein
MAIRTAVDADSMLLEATETSSRTPTRGFGADSDGNPGIYDKANDRWDARFTDALGVAMSYKTTVTGVGTGTGVRFAFQNPFGRAVKIFSGSIDKTTGASASGTVDMGVAANGTTSSDTLIDGAVIDGAAIVLTNIENKGSNGRSVVKMGATDWITLASSASLAGLVATITIVAVPD